MVISRKSSNRATRKSSRTSRKITEKTSKSEKLIRCCYVKSDDSYYGVKYFEESVSGSITKVDTGQSKWPYKYPDGDVTYKIVGDTKDIASYSILKKTINHAVTAIDVRIENIDLKFEHNNNKKTDIEIHFSHDDATFIERPSVLAYAYLVTKDPEKNPVSKQIVFNDRHYWSVFGGDVSAHKVDPIHYDKGTKVKLKSEPFLQVLIHEFIHKLGLRHDMKEKNAIMWPYSKDPVHPYSLNLHPRDISRLQEKYGKRHVSESVLKSLRYIRGRF